MQYIIFSKRTKFHVPINFTTFLVFVTLAKFCRYLSRWSNRYKDQGIVLLDGNPGTSLRHPGWESLFYSNTSHCILHKLDVVNQKKFNTIFQFFFLSALTVAFELLRDSFNDADVGANCNQAIMLVTDGVPYKWVNIKGWFMIASICLAWFQM